jgi:hypothetical protein
MGMEDRDWYREKRIDWNRGGLRKRLTKKRRIPGYVWWILVLVLFIAAAALLGRL